MSAEAERLGAAVGDRVLLLRERHADDLDAAMLGEIEAQPTPTATDVEHALAWPQVQLGGQMPFLGKLRLVEAGDAVFPEGAGILQVGAEEERIEPAVEVVVGMDVLARPAERVHLPQAAGRQPPGADGHHRQWRQRIVEVLEDHHQEVEDRPLLDDQAAVRERFAEPEVGIADDNRFGLGTGEAYAHGLAPPVAEGKCPALGVDDFQRPLANGLGQIRLQCGIHRVSVPAVDALPLPRIARRRPSAPADDKPDLGLVSSRWDAVKIRRFPALRQCRRLLPRRSLHPRPPEPLLPPPRRRPPR